LGIDQNDFEKVWTLIFQVNLSDLIHLLIYYLIN
jgi:hypothetical protein